MRSSRSEAVQGGSNKKRTVILLRSAVVVSTSYLILFAQEEPSRAGIAYILTLLLSNVALFYLPPRLFQKPQFSAALLLGDTAAVLVGLYHTVGFSQDFLIVYFFTIFLTTAAASISQIAIGATLVATLYGYWLWVTTAHGLGSGEWLRLPFFFIIAIFYAYVTEETKRERRRRVHAERETEHLRFLLTLGNTLSEPAAGSQLLSRVGTLIEAAFPHLTCATYFVEPKGSDAGLAIPIALKGRDFGWLSIRPRDGRPLGAEEEQSCRLVAIAATKALYSSEQADAGRDVRRVKEEFLGVLSHELRTPIHAILGYSEMLEMAIHPEDEGLARESLERLRANACRMQDLVEEMLCFAELRAGQHPVEVEDVDLRELFEQFEGNMKGQLAARPIEFRWEVAADVPSQLRADKRKIRQILTGLLSNAAKFTEKGFVELTAKRLDESHLELRVRDTGIGIDPKDFRAIFEQFRQLDTSLTRRFDGVGLGLALAQELAHSLGGRIRVESRPQCGALFRVLLPLRESGKMTAVESSKVASSGDAMPVFLRAARSGAN